MPSRKPLSKKASAKLRKWVLNNPQVIPIAIERLNKRQNSKRKNSKRKPLSKKASAKLRKWVLNNPQVIPIAIERLNKKQNSKRKNSRKIY